MLFFCNLFFNKAYRSYFLINFQGYVDLQEDTTKPKDLTVTLPCSQSVLLELKSVSIWP